MVPAVLAVLVFLGGLFGAHLIDKGRAVSAAFLAGQVDVQGRWDGQRAAELAAALTAGQARAAEDLRRVKAQREIDHENQRLVQSRAAAARDSRDAVDRLRAAAAGFTSRAGLSRDSATAVDGDTAATFRKLLEDSAEDHRRLGLETDEIAAVADECAARYRALN